MNRAESETIRRLKAVVQEGKGLLIESKLKNRHEDLVAFDSFITGEFKQTNKLLLDLEQYDLYNEVLGLMGCSSQQ